jgi:hypothetical protein
MKAFSKKSKEELKKELKNDFNNNLFLMADNYGRTEKQMFELIFKN